MNPRKNSQCEIVTTDGNTLDAFFNDDGNWEYEIDGNTVIMPESKVTKWILLPSNLDTNQRRAISDILKNKRMCITSDCGFGKTIVGLSAFYKVRKKDKSAKMLVVCTPTGVKGTWSKEHHKWKHLRRLKVEVLTGSPAERKNALNREADVYVISYNNLKWLKDNNPYKFTFVYPDEADCLKGAMSKWRSYLITISEYATWRILSTATPMTRDQSDFWGLCLYMDNGKALGTTVTEFRNEYMDRVSIPNSHVEFWKMRKNKVKQLEDKIKHLFFNYDLSAEASIPIVTRTYNASLSPESQAKYDALQNEQCINSIILDEKGKVDLDKSMNALLLSMKLDQLSSGFVYVDDTLRVDEDNLKRLDISARKLVNDAKVKKAIDIFDDRVRAVKRFRDKIDKTHGGKPVAICHYFTHEREHLFELYPDALSDEDPDFENKWNSGEYATAIMQYSRSAKSRNLQKGGNIILYYSPTFKWVDDYQIARRFARQGQTADKVYAYRLYMKGTVDDEKTKRLGDRFGGHLNFQKKIIGK